jgi:hypothetical protein
VEQIPVNPKIKTNAAAILSKLFPDPERIATSFPPGVFSQKSGTVNASCAS